MSARKADPAIIRAARARITPEGAWIKGWIAKDISGVKVWPLPTKAVCWCGEGSIRASGGGYLEAEALADYLEVDFFSRWNDAPDRTQAEVLAAMDGCAEALEQGRL